MLIQKVVKRPFEIPLSWDNQVYLEAWSYYYLLVIYLQLSDTTVVWKIVSLFLYSFVWFSQLIYDSQFYLGNRHQKAFLPPKKLGTYLLHE